MRLYDWARGETLDNSIKEALNKDLDIVSEICLAMETDSENESRKLLNRYLAANEQERAIMDDMLVTLCGYTMETIIAKASETADCLTEDEEED